MASRTLPRDHEIQKRRVNEERREALELVRKQNSNWRNQAVWQNKSYDAQVRQRSSLKLQELKAHDEEALYKRKTKLAHLFEHERQQYEREFQSSFETAEERREKLRTRAQEVKQKRESSRRQFAQAMLKRQQRNAQDEMRLEQSRLRTLQVSADRRSQLDDRVKESKARAADDAEFARVWEEDRVSKAQREVHERHLADTRNAQMKEMLDQQVNHNETRKSREIEARQTEQGKWRENWAKEDEEEKIRNFQKLEDQREARYKTQRDNNDRAQMRALDKSEEMSLDLYLLQQQQAKDAHAEAAENAERNRMRQSQREFQEHLVAMAQKEHQDDSVFEKVRKQEQEKEWKKREDQWEAEEQDRKSLMREVDRTRQDQIKEKAMLREREARESAAWTQQWGENARLANEAEAARMTEQRGRRRENRDFIVKQIDDRKHMQAMEKQRGLLEEKRSQSYTKQFEEEIKTMRKELQQNGVGLESFHRTVNKMNRH